VKHQEQRCRQLTAILFKTTGYASTSKGAPPSTATNDENVNKRSARTSSRGSEMDSLPPSPKKLPNRKDGALEASRESENEGFGVQKGSVPTSDNEKEEEQPVIGREYFAVKLESQGEYEDETPAFKRDGCAVKLEISDSEKEETKPVIKAEYAATKVESDSENSGKEEKSTIKTKYIAVKLERGSEKEDEKIFQQTNPTRISLWMRGNWTSIVRMNLLNAARNSGIQGLATI
jgi:hypothetical protein